MDTKINNLQEFHNINLRFIGLLMVHNLFTNGSNFDKSTLEHLKDYDIDLFNIVQKYLKSNINYEKYKEEVDNHKSKLNQILNDCIIESNNKNLYFIYCTFKVYKNTFDTRFNETQIQYPDYDIERFILEEYQSINSYYILNDFLDRRNRINLDITFSKKIEFLEDIAKSKGYIINDVLNFDDFMDKFEESTKINSLDFILIPIQSDEELDFQIESNLNAKILILDQLGFIELIKNKCPNISGNQISKLLATLIEEKHSSITPLINRLLQPNQENDNKHPYYSIASKNKVKDLLKKFGLSFKDRFKSN